jgi:outer membrane protein TolC
MRRFLASLLLLVVPGCTLDQQRDVTAWRTVLEADLPPPPGDLAPGAPLSLRHALRLASARNETLAMRGEDYVQARIARDRAVATFLPTVALSPTYTRQDETSIGGGMGGLPSFVPEESLDVPASSRLSLNPLRQLPAVTAATEAAAAGQADLREARARLLADVARTFYAVLIAERRAAVLEESLRTEQARVRDLQANLAAGTAAPLEVSRARASAAQVEGQLIDARGAAARGRTTLALLIGTPAPTGRLTASLAVPDPTPDVDGFLAAAREHRPDLHAAAARTRSAAAGVQAAFGGYFPEVTVDFSYFFERESFPDDVDWRLGLGVDVPIFTAGRVENDIRAAYSHLRQARAGERWLTRQIEEEVRNAWRECVDSHARRRTLRERAAAAAEARRAADTAFASGVATDLDVDQAEDDLREAQLALATEQLAAELRWLLLLRAAGELGHRILPPSHPGDPE